MKIGIFIGSFNPPHLGHLDIIKYLLNKKYVDKILIVPTKNYWNKTNLIDIAGHRPPRRALCHGKQSDDPPQEHHGHSGGQRSPGPGASGRMRALRAPHPVRI